MVVTDRNLNNLKITYKRSFKPDEMDGLNKLVSSPVQNDFLFYEGSLLLSLGMGNEPFQLRCSLVSESEL